MKKLRRVQAHLRGGTPLTHSLARDPIIDSLKELIRGGFTRLCIALLVDDAYDYARTSLSVKSRTSFRDAAKRHSVRNL